MWMVDPPPNPEGYEFKQSQRRWELLYRGSCECCEETDIIIIIKFQTANPNWENQTAKTQRPQQGRQPGKENRRNTKINKFAISEKLELHYKFLICSCEDITHSLTKQPQHCGDMVASHLLLSMVFNHRQSIVRNDNNRGQLSIFLK